MPFQIDLSGLGQALTTIGQDKARKKATQLYQEALVSDDPQAIQNILSQIAQLSPEIHSVVAPRLLEKAQSIQDAKTTFDSFLASMGNLVKPEEIEGIKKLMETNPQKAGEVITQLYLGQLGEKVESRGKLQTEAELAESLEAEKLFQKNLEREIEATTKKAEALLPFKIAEVEALERIRAKYREAGRRGLNPMTLLNFFNQNLKDLSNRQDKLTDKIKELSDDPDIQQHLKPIKLPGGELIDNASLFYLVQTNPSNLKEALKSYHIEPSEDNMKQITEIFNNMQRELPRNIRQKLLAYGEAQATNLALDITMDTYANLSDQILGAMGIKIETPLGRRPIITSTPFESPGGTLPFGQTLPEETKEAPSILEGASKVIDEAVNLIKEAPKTRPAEEIIDNLTHFLGRPLTPEERNRIIDEINKKKEVPTQILGRPLTKEEQERLR